MPIPLGILAVAGASAGVVGAFEQIATQSGTGSSGTITFSSIPQTYQHQQIRATMRTSASLGSIGVRTNNSAGTYDYNSHRFSNNSTELTSQAFAGSYGFISFMPGSNNSANIYGNNIIEFNDYTTSKKKTITAVGGVFSSRNGIHTFFNNANADAITTITIFDAAGGNFQTGSRFALFGIKG